MRSEAFSEKFPQRQAPQFHRRRFVNRRKKPKVVRFFYCTLAAANIDEQGAERLSLVRPRSGLRSCVPAFGIWSRMMFTRKLVPFAAALVLAGPLHGQLSLR